MRISDWSSDVCSSDLVHSGKCAVGRQSRRLGSEALPARTSTRAEIADHLRCDLALTHDDVVRAQPVQMLHLFLRVGARDDGEVRMAGARLLHDLSRVISFGYRDKQLGGGRKPRRSEEHTSELQSLMRNSYAVFCLKKKTSYIRTPQ